MKPPGNRRFLWIQIILIEKRRVEKIGDADAETLADLVDDPQFHGIVGTVDNVADGGFGDTAFAEELVLGHTAFVQ